MGKMVGGARADGEHSPILLSTKVWSLEMPRRSRMRNCAWNMSCRVRKERVEHTVSHHCPIAIP